MRYDQPMTPAEMVESHPVVARGYYAGARENLVSPGVTPEQTVGDNVFTNGFPIKWTNFDMQNAAVVFFTIC